MPCECTDEGDTIVGEVITCTYREIKVHDNRRKNPRKKLGHETKTHRASQIVLKRGARCRIDRPFRRKSSS